MIQIEPCMHILTTHPVSPTSVTQKLYLALDNARFSVEFLRFSRQEIIVIGLNSLQETDMIPVSMLCSGS